MDTNNLHIISGVKWNPDIPATILAKVSTELDPVSEQADRINLLIVVTFRRHQIDQGWFVKTKVSFACTKAQITLWETTENFVFESHSGSEFADIKYTLADEKRRELTICPKIKASVGEAEVEAEVITASLERELTETAEFSKSEAVLTAIDLGDRGVEWNIDPVNHTSAVRNFLQQTLKLTSSGRRLRHGLLSFDVKVSPGDRRLFDPKLRPLGRIWSTGILVKILLKQAFLLRKNQVPGFNDIECQFEITPDSEHEEPTAN